MTEAQIQASSVGGAARHDAPITLVDYGPEWPALFVREEGRIRSILGDSVIRLEHTGSTSVPGLAAKPIIDIAMTVPNSADETAHVTQLEAADYRLTIREPEWHEHRMFKGPDTNINLHTYTAGDPAVDRMVAFRDWLRTHDAEPRVIRADQACARGADVGLRPELRRRQDRGRRGDHCEGHSRGVALTAALALGTVRGTLMNSYFYFQGPA
jgi:GrpB-like predicted nucleotidyltransferase (UPF0157 family)